VDKLKSSCRETWNNGLIKRALENKKMNEIGDGELKVLALVGFVTNSGK